MTELTELERARIDASRDSKSVTPDQILRLALDDLRRDLANADACIVILICKPQGTKDGSSNTYRANLSRVEEIAYLEGSKSRALKGWLSE